MTSQAQAASAGEARRTTVDALNPWPGLAAFLEADAAFFFGRDRPSADLTQLLTQHRLVVLYGRSGLGKTSLLRAGVFPKLRDARFLPVYVRVDFRSLSDTSDTTTLRRQVKTAIEQAARDARVEAPAIDPNATIWEWLYRTDARFWNERSRRVQPVLVFDQFEEAFTHGRRTDATSALTSQFLGEIVDVVRGSVPATVAARLEQQASEALAFTIDRDVCHVLLSLRKEYLPELLRLRSHLPTLLDNRLELRGMTHEEAAHVVTGPGRDLVEPGVETLIVEFVARARRSIADQTGDETMVDPAILSVFCRELNRRRQEEQRAKIDATLLEGNRDTIIAEFYDESVKDLGPGVERFIESSLITESGYRNSVAVEQALLETGITRDVVNQLIDRRLVRSEGSGPEERLELTHDVLADPIMARRNTRREREREEEERAEAAERMRVLQAEADRERRERDLKIAQLDASTAVQLLAIKRHANIIQRWLLAGLAILLIAALAMSWRSWMLSQEVQSNLARAHVEQAIGLIASGRQDQGLAFVAEALRDDPDNVAARSLAIDAVLHTDWPLPIAQLKHEGSVLWAEFDRAGSRVVTGSSDNEARIWSVPAGQPVGAPLKHDGPVTRARFTADGTKLLTISDDGLARLWDVAAGRELQRYAHPNPDAAVSWAAYAPIALAGTAGTIVIVTGATDGTVCVWTDGTVTRAFKAHDDRLVGAQFSPDGAYLLTASADRTARVWNWRTGARLATLTHEQPLTSAQFSGDGALIATASQDGSARIWEAPRGRLIALLPHDPRAVPKPKGVPEGDKERTHVTSAQFNADVTLVVTAGADGFARLWDPRSGAAIGVPMAHGGPVVSAMFSPLGGRVITGSSDQTARIWDPRGRPIGNALMHDTGLRSASFSRDLQYVLTAAEGNTATIWDVRQSSSVPPTLWLPENPALVRFAPNGQDIVFWSAAGAGSWALWDGTTSEPRSLFEGQSGIRSMDFSRDGERVVRLDAEGVSIARWPGSEEGVRLADKEVDVARISLDGRLVVTGAPDGTARTWNAATGAQVAESRHTSPVSEVQVSADSARVLSRAGLSHARVWEAQTGRTIHDIAGADQIVAVRFAQSPVLVVTVEADDDKLRSARLTDVATGKVVRELRHETPILGGGFSADGQTLFTLSSDGKVKLWESSTGLPIATLIQEGKIGYVEFSRDGQRLVTASSSGAVRVWGTQTGQAHTASLRIRGALGIDVVRFSPDGQRLLAVSAPEATAEGRRTTAIRIWDVPTGDAADAEGLASLIQALSGHRVNHLGVQTLDADRVAAVSAERAKPPSAREGSLATRLRAWTLGDRASRTIGPFTTVTIDEFVRTRTESSGAREALEWFPWHGGLSLAAADPARSVVR